MFRAYVALRAALSREWQAAEPGGFDTSSAERSAAFVLCAALLHRAQRGRADWSATKEWFTEGRPLPIVVPPWVWDGPRLAQVGDDLPEGKEVAELFPLVGEVFVTGPTGASRLADLTLRNERAIKRRQGVFYTPTDVADFLGRGAADSWYALKGHGDANGPPRCLDPACGTGVLLRALLDQLSGRHDANTSDARVSLVEGSLFGVDLNQVALDVAAFTLLARCLEVGPLARSSPATAWARIRANLMQGDAVSAASTLEGARHGEVEQAELPMVLQPEEALVSRLRALTPFDIVIANPPYSGSDPTKCGPIRRAAYLPFVRMMWTLSQGGSAASIVLPLSIASGSSRALRRLRREMLSVSGVWRFSFYDRAPDSLFGDDVKTRAAIALFQRASTSPPRVFTSPLRRWSSRSRETLFREIPYTELPPELLDDQIPKLGSVEEVSLLRSLRIRSTTLQSSAIRTLDSAELAELRPRDRSRALLVGPTAYNFLPIQPLSEGTVLGGNMASGCWGLLTRSKSEAFGLLALLCSRMMYWKWCVEGDGFHLTQRFVLDAPFSLHEVRLTLHELGEQLWDKMSATEVRSVNKGRETLSYSPLAGAAVLGRIDRALLTMLGQPTALEGMLREFQEAMVLAGRPLQQRNRHHFPRGAAEEP